MYRRSPVGTISRYLPQGPQRGLPAMASDITLFLGLITSCLLLTGCRCLECYSCNNPSDVGCSASDKTICNGDDNICTAVSFSVKTGNRTENRIVKGCDKGSPINSIDTPNSNGIQIRSSKLSCNSSLCNENVLDFRKEFSPEQDSSASTLECYSCFSLNKSKCLKESAEKVKCPDGFDACYEAEGNLTIVTTTVQVFVKKCSFSTNNPNIIISGDWYNISLIAQYCTGNLCNDNPVTTANPTTEVVTRNVTDSPTKPVQPVTPAIQKTTNGIGGIHSCYVTTIFLVLMKSFL